MKRNLSPYTGCEERQLILLIRSDRSLYGAFCFGMRKSFILYIDSFEVLQHLSDEQLGKLTRLLFKYQIDGSTPEVNDPLFFPFGFIRATMDRDNEKWEQRADRARTNGTKGGRPKENQEGYQETQETQSVISKPKEPVSVSVSVSGSVNASVSENVKLDNGVSNETKSKSYKHWSVDDFKQSILDNRLEYSKEMLNSFFEYWSELNVLGKPKFTTEKTWETDKRLKRWYGNNSKFTPTKPQQIQFNRSSTEHYK